MLLNEIIDDTVCLCEVYTTMEFKNDSESVNQLQDLRKALEERQRQLEDMLTKLNMCNIKLSHVLNPPKRPEEMYNVYNI